MEETIQAAEITILTIKHVAVARACNKVTIHGISKTVLKEFVLFLYQLDTLNFPFTSTILAYLSLHVSDQSVHHQENQMLNYTSSFWHRSLRR
jgi:hypothetical protein